MYHSAEILEDTVIGAHCLIGSCCFLGAGCRIGDGTLLHHSVGLPAGTVVGQRCYLGVHLVCTDVKYVILSDRGQEVHRPPVIEDDVVLGVNVSLSPGIVIGRGAQIGHGSVITRTVPAGWVMVGNPARRLR